MKFIGITAVLILLSGTAAFGLVAVKKIDADFCDKVLYVVFGKTFLSDVYVMFSDGEVKKLSPTEEGIYYQAHISRDGKRVVFYGNQSGPPRIWLSDLDRGATLPLTPENVSARQPVFSWDGSMIAFSSNFDITQKPERIELMHGTGRPPKNNTLNIYVMDTDGGNLRRITSGRFIDQRPAFSPDGQTIAFVSNRSGSEKIWTVSLDGKSDPVQMQHEGFGYRPVYSPDGENIYLFTSNNKNHQLCYISISSGNTTLLDEFGKGDEHGPYVSYDGKRLLMHSNRSGKWEIWEVLMEEKKLQKVRVPFEEALHATVSENGTIAFDVPKIHKMRKALSAINASVDRTTNYLFEMCRNLPVFFGEANAVSD